MYHPQSMQKCRGNDGVGSVFVGIFFVEHEVVTSVTADRKNNGVFTEFLLVCLVSQFVHVFPILHRSPNVVSCGWIYDLVSK
jgi:hypothetical protein